MIIIILVCIYSARFPRGYLITRFLGLWILLTILTHFVPTWFSARRWRNMKTMWRRRRLFFFSNNRRISRYHRSIWRKLRLQRIRRFNESLIRWIIVHSRTNTIEIIVQTIIPIVAIVNSWSFLSWNWISIWLLLPLIWLNICIPIDAIPCRISCVVFQWLR